MGYLERERTQFKHDLFFTLIFQSKLFVIDIESEDSLLFSMIQ